ncbi:MAG: glycosyltransferase family 4 protein [bacterium]|nr:MAG: glycosyltransferase family 4 protein [bacterium]
MRRMKILAINWRDIENPDAGGAEVHLHEILSHLVRWGYEATQISAAFPGCTPEKEIDGIRILRHGHWFDANFTIPQFARRHLSKNSYDIILEDINKVPFYMPLVTRTPVVPVVPHLFGTTVFRETNAVFGLYVWFWESFIPLVYRKSVFLVISPSTRDDLVSRGVPAERIKVILCGLDHQRYRNLDLERFERPTIVHLGRLRKYKSVEVAVRAMIRIRERIPEARLVIIGTGPHQAVLEREVQRLGLTEAVEFKGYMESEELVRYLNRTHLVMNPSPKEGWGLTVVEANACGVPVVASDRPGLRDSVMDGETGILVPYGDERAFAARAVEILEDRELHGRLREGALRRVRELTWERCASETKEFLESTLG